jgi:hypothetical protein
MMDQTQIDAIKARRAAVTPGEWEIAKAGEYRNGKPVTTEWFVRREDDDVSIAADILDPETSQPSYANTAFIAHAPADIDALLNEVERLADENQNLRKMTSALLREVAASILEDVVSDD